MGRVPERGINVLSLIVGVICFFFCVQVSFGWVEYFLNKPLNLQALPLWLKYGLPISITLTLSATVGIFIALLLDYFIKSVA